ncbi:NADH:ubiquinone oxidoreductase subunit NDUFA12 [Pseudoroseicyclus tamaricis]|uniref:NADH:ubiquinone oxidoreductase subunit NDUFA12 n=1 Tax=Pseudoroseicyclus tamaricis TaxID=2705421 RepID=A0A6B2JQH4_9RHOB|nr:NADH:ubiquinone oxidoreductase subunit NDUFA12 [Pseudoroseicyclus tamaricis]NDV00937.1 NADH:ubiquinone oxidoreductase subunit NDUFA12 [Pseudoroseicyclus tamaricis]
MGLKTFISRVFTWWNGQTLGTQLFTARRGVKVGEDAEGNVYYHNKDDSKRWVIYNGYAEASRVSPEWHGWLHRSWDDPPSVRPLPHKTWEKPHIPNLTGTPAAYAPAGSLRRSPAERTDYESWSPE